MNMQLIKNKQIAWAEEMKNSHLKEKTIKKYMRDVTNWLDFYGGNPPNTYLNEYENYLLSKYKVGTVNSIIMSINKFISWTKFDLQKMQYVKTQSINSPDILTRTEYEMMLNYAKKTGRMKMYYIMKTLASTGIRIAELKYITRETLEEGTVHVYNKSKERVIIMANSLCDALRDYSQKEGISSGIIFFGNKKGKPITPSAVWQNMQFIAKQSGVALQHAHPHNLRHLFARTYIEITGNISELADILGHENLETTRRYLVSTIAEKRKNIEQMNL